MAAKPRVRREVHELMLLFEISQTLEASMELRDCLRPILKLMAKYTGMLRGTIGLVTPDGEEVRIEAAYGLSETQEKMGVYRMGEGVTGKVARTGRSEIVPCIDEDPEFLNRTGARRKLKRNEISFICVPIKGGSQVIGTLSADRLFTDDVSLEEDLRLLKIIAAMIAQSVSLRQRIMSERQKLLAENTRLQSELKERFRPDNILGNSAEMESVCALIEQVTGSATTVLIRGESGTGKELVAHAIHANSPRASKPYIKVNCAALPETVIESELFGHEKGAFTGAIQARKGRFELADGGTIFLDEIGDLSPTMQVKLLRALQEKEFERVGGTETLKVDVRVLAATNRDLEKLMVEEKFRNDLYYRLNVFPIHIPPLRERRSDILLLANSFVEKFSNAHHKKILRISTPAIDMLMSYHWPGNVRELENCIERAVLLSTDDVIHGHHLPPTLQTAEASNTRFTGSLQESLDNLERDMLLDALKSARGNRAKAARQLGISERLMGLRVQKHQIDARRFKTKW